MCEAYGLSQDPGLRRSAQKAINYIVNAQHDGGGWRYGPARPGDTSVTGWQIMALKSGQMAGLDVPTVACRPGQSLPRQLCNADEGYGYTDPAQAARPHDRRRPAVPAVSAELGPADCA